LPSEAVKRKVTAVISLGWAQQGDAPLPRGFENMIVLEGVDYARFKTDLREHRAKFALNDVEYAEQVLKISLNTFKKCINSPDRIALTRPTFLHLFANTGLRPKDYGLPLTLPAADSPYGGYDKSDFEFICGRYFLYRRSFLTATNVNKSVLDLYHNTSRECLSFQETICYISDAGAPHEQAYSGDVYIDQDLATLSFLAFLSGQVRLTLVTMPQRPIGREKLKLRGALLTHGMARGFWQPTVSCVFAEGPQDVKQAPVRDLCGTIRPEMDDFKRISAELRHCEEHATIVTPLMWHMSNAARPEIG
jgi:hypothetical protein